VILALDSGSLPHMGCSGCGSGKPSRAGSASSVRAASLRARLALSAVDSGGDSEPATEVTTVIPVGGSNAISGTIVVYALVAGTISVAIYGSNDLCTWTHVGDIADMSSVGSSMGQVASVSTAYVRALAALKAEVGKSAQCIVGIHLHASSL